jgi:hypothetical protein
MEFPSQSKTFSENKANNCLSIYIMEEAELKILEKIKPSREESKAVFSFAEKLLEVSSKIDLHFFAYKELV